MMKAYSFSIKYGQGQGYVNEADLKYALKNSIDWLGAGIDAYVVEPTYSIES